MEIRRATMADAADIFTCNVNAFKGYIMEMGKAPAPMLMDYSAELQQHDLFVACEDGELLGFTLILDDEADFMWLDVLAVDPRHQGKGVGKQLLDFTEEFILEQGKQECRLYTNVKFKNTIDIYLHCGFEVYERTVVNGYDRYYMKKTLGKK